MSDSGENSPLFTKDRLFSKRKILGASLGTAATTLLARLKTHSKPTRVIKPNPETSEITESGQQKLTEFLLPNSQYTPAEKDAQLKQIKFWEDKFKYEPGFTSFKQNTRSQIATIGSSFERVSQMFYRKGVKIPPEWRKVFAGLVFVESGGKPAASSGVALGLSQLQGIAAEEANQTARLLGYDLKNPLDNTTLGLTYLFNSAQRVNFEPGLSIWSYHLGPTGMRLAIRQYLLSELKLPAEEIDQKLSNSPMRATAEYTKTYKLNPTKLLSSQAVVNCLKANNYYNDTTNEYFNKVAAATLTLVSDYAI